MDMMNQSFFLEITIKSLELTIKSIELFLFFSPHIVDVEVSSSPARRPRAPLLLRPPSGVWHQAYLGGVFREGNGYFCSKARVVLG